MRSFNLRGTSGSGKTWIAKELMVVADPKPILYEGKKIRAYEGIIYNHPFIFLGSYETKCGGCDTIPKVSIVADLLDMYMARDEVGIILYEGLMISHMIGTVGNKVRELGQNKGVLAFLDTPLETCLDRVRARRVERGDLRPFNTDNTTKDWKRVRGARANAISQGFRVIDIDHKKSTHAVMPHLWELISEQQRDTGVLDQGTRDGTHSEGGGEA